MDKDNYALMTGLFLTILIGAIIVISTWIGNLHEPRNSYVIATKGAVSGLAPDSTVFYRGIAAGKVKAVLFDPDDTTIILVPIEINRNLTLTRGVVANLRMKGVTGLTEIELTDSGNNQERLPTGTDKSNRITLQRSMIDRLSGSGETMLENTNQLLTRLNQILDDNSEQRIRHILANVETATSDFITLEKQASGALATIPALSADAQHTLALVDQLANEFIPIAKQLNTTTQQITKLTESSTVATDIVIETTLPQINVLLVELQTTIREVKRVALLLENDPQALLMGAQANKPGPGETGYREPN